MKLSLGIMLMAVPLFILALCIMFIHTQDNVKREARERANYVLDVTLQRLNRYLKTAETATNANQWLITGNLQPDSLLALTRRIVQLNGNVDGCSISAEPNVFPEYGRYFSVYTIREGDSIISTVEEQYEYFEKIWYRTPKNNKNGCWVDYFDETDSLEVTLDGRLASYGLPIYDDNNKLVAIISSEKPYPNSYFFMIGENGSYYIHPDSTRLFSQTIFDGLDERRAQDKDIIVLGHKMTNGEKGNMRVTIDGTPCLVCYQPVPETKWSIALVCPDKDILKSINHLTLVIVVLIIFGLLLIMLLCRRAVSKAISPVNHLVRQAQLIAAGQYDEHIPHSMRTDVIGRLQNSFATMQESLDQHVSYIQQLNVQTAQRNEELKHANQLAEESNRQKTAFVQNMTHQIRTPLNIIMGFAQVLDNDTKQMPEEEVRSITSMMSHNSNTLSRMVSMLYDSSEIGIGQSLSIDKNEVVACNELARECISYVDMHFPGIVIHLETDIPDTLTIHTNHLYLMRSLREILYNSAKYSDGQNIVLRVKEIEGNIRFTFEDTGPGIAKEFQDTIFVPFMKVNDLSEGLGLGLPLAKYHMYNLGGTFYIDFDYHDGCRIIMEIPKR